MNIAHLLLGAPLVLGVILFAVFIVYPRYKIKKNK